MTRHNKHVHYFKCYAKNTILHSEINESVNQTCLQAIARSWNIYRFHGYVPAHFTHTCMFQGYLADIDTLKCLEMPLERYGQMNHINLPIIIVQRKNKYNRNVLTFYGINIAYSILLCILSSVSALCEAIRMNFTHQTRPQLSLINHVFSIACPIAYQTIERYISQAPLTLTVDK